MKTARATVLRGLTLGLAVLGLMAFHAPPASAAPSVEVSATSGLTDGQTITVSGSGFAPNLKGIAVGQCKEGFAGPADCNLQGGATFRNADGSGRITMVTLKLAMQFNGVDCSKVQCVIGVAPLPNANSADVVAANSVVVPLEFAAAGGGGGTAPVVDTTSEGPAPEPESSPAAGGESKTTAAAPLPQTGPANGLPVVVIAGSAFLLLGTAGLLLVPGRRRNGGQA